SFIVELKITADELAGSKNTDSKENAELAELSGQPVRFYHGTAECFGNVRWVREVDIEAGPTGQDRQARTRWVAQLALADAALAEPGHRFILRYQDEGITGGTVLLNARPRWFTRAKLDLLVDALLVKDYKKAVSTAIEASPQGVLK